MSGILGDLKANQDKIEDLRIVLETIRLLPQVAVTVGLLESILLRAASYKALKQDAPLDSALAQTLVGLIAGDVSTVELIVAAAEEQGFNLLKLAINRDVISPQMVDGQFELDAIL